MSGMAGNVTMFNTLCTHVIQEPYIRPHQTDRHYLKVGRFETVFGVVFSILGGHLEYSFNNIRPFVGNGGCEKRERRARSLGLRRLTRSRVVRESCEIEVKNHNWLVSC
jgi:hypothetical protein